MAKVGYGDGGGGGEGGGGGGGGGSSVLSKSATQIGNGAANLNLSVTTENGGRMR